MRRDPKILKYCTLAILSMGAIAQPAFAEPVWHCSRSDVQIANASDDFTLAALILDREVIRVSLRDLYSVYQDTPVRMNGGMPLSACVITGSTSLTRAALQSLGTQPHVVRTLASTASLSKTNIHLVTDESYMLACITKNHPAIGYLSKDTHTEAVGPCF